MKIRIDYYYNTVYEDTPKQYNFWFKYRNKKELIKKLKEEKEIKADCRTTYTLIEKRFNER